MVELWMVFEAVAADKQTVEDSMENHVDLLEEENGVQILSLEKEDIKEVENPHPTLDTGFSQVIETQVEAEDFARAVKLVINYGPTYVQIEGPDPIEMNLKESQQALQEVANIMHQYAQQGAGGVIVSGPSDEEPQG